MALAPIYCEKCNRRTSPTESIFALGNMAVGKCCFFKEEIEGPSENPKSKSDYDIFINNGFSLYHIDEFLREVKHPVPEGKKYAICLLRTNSLESRTSITKRYQYIWVLFESDGNWDIFTKSPFAKYYHDTNAEYLIRKASRYMTPSELDSFIKEKLY